MASGASRRGHLRSAAVRSDGRPPSASRDLGNLAGASDPGGLLPAPGDEPLPGDHAHAGRDQPRHGERSDHRARSPGDELSPGQDRRRGDQTVDEPVDGVVGVMDAEVHPELARADLVQDPLELIGQTSHEVVRPIEASISSQPSSTVNRSIGLSQVAPPLNDRIIWIVPGAEPSGSNANW